MNKIIRSPFFYVGDKYKLMPQLIELFPDKIKTYYEPFVGGGSSFLNVRADKYILNDNNEWIIKLHKFFQENKKNKEKIINDIYNIIDSYELSCSYRGITVPNDIKTQFKKTYYAKFNKKGYMKIRDKFNIDQSNLLLLYVLLIYGFNHMIRFNKNGLFNLPVGNVDFNGNVNNAIINYLNFAKNNDMFFSSMDFIDFLDNATYNEGEFIYLDTPYLISNSEYNKTWSEDLERKLYKKLDELNEKGVKFGISNLVYHKEKSNTLLIDWMDKYTVYEINSNYISRFDNKIKNSREVYITNYVKS